MDPDPEEPRRVGYFVGPVLLAFGELGVDDIVARAAAGIGVGAIAPRGCRALGTSGLLIHRCTSGIERLLQGFELRFHGVEIVLLDGLLEFGGGRLHLGLVFGAHLVAQLSELLVGLVDERFRLVLQVDALPLFLVNRGIGLGVLHHLVHLVVAQGGGTGDGDALLLAAALVLSRHAEDAVGVDIEGHLDLGHAPG